MKIRSDFVTNSSSSSFILGFTSEEAAEKELAMETAITDEEKKTVLFDCKRSGFVPFAEIEEEARDLIESDAFLDAKIYHSWREHYDKYADWCDSPECAQLEKDVYAEKYEEFKKSAEGKEVFSIVEYDDHCNYKLESALYHLQCTVLAINCH